jgi:hypothetical protein
MIFFGVIRVRRLFGIAFVVPGIFPAAIAEVSLITLDIVIQI